MLDKAFYGLPNIIEAQQFQKDWIVGPFFREVKLMEQIVAQRGCEILKKKIVIVFFDEPSTRTSYSFRMATLYLGAQVLSTDAAGIMSSFSKDETLEDGIKVLCEYKPDAIVLRHHEEGAAARALKVSSVPIINAGDGRGQHPTQALLDILTIQKELGHIDGVNIAMVGDLVNGRTVRSLCYLLGKFEGMVIHFVSPPCAQMKPDIKAYLERHSVKFTESTDLRKIAAKVDVIYQTRTQKERGTAFDRNDHSLGYFVVNQEILKLMKKDAIIMHPLPRVDEITSDVDSDPRAAYFRQAGNGLYTRMALLKMILAPKS